MHIMKDFSSISSEISLGFPFKGGMAPYFQQSIGRGIGKGLVSWLGSGVYLNGVGTGTSGAGSLSGTYLISPNQLLVEGSLRSGGLLGVGVSDLALAINLSVSGVYSLVGSSSGVGTGTFTGVGTNLVGDLGILTGYIGSGLKSEGILGDGMIVGISIAVYDLVRSCIVLKGSIFGPPSSAPSSVPLQIFFNIVG